MKVRRFPMAAVVATLALAPSRDPLASEMPVPTSLQVALFKKIFEYDRTLQSQENVQVVVVHQGPESPAARELVKEFQNGGIRAMALPAGELEASLGAVDVVYLLPGVDPGPLEAWCVRKGVLSVSGLPELVATGKVAVGIGLKEQKAEILVHIRRVKAEGHELAAGLLSLATVIR